MARHTASPKTSTTRRRQSEQAKPRIKLADLIRPPSNRAMDQSHPKADRPPHPHGGERHRISPANQPNTQLPQDHARAPLTSTRDSSAGTPRRGRHNTTDSQRSKAMSKRARTKQNCMVCLDTVDEGHAESYRCSRCKRGVLCVACLKHWFIEACKDESQMPPQCCSIIPVSKVSKLLTAAQIELYEAKFEEWSTYNKLYCPVPTCSTFIRPKLYIIQQSTAKESRPHGSGLSAPVEASQAIEPQVTCPTCGVSICTECHAITHDGDCKNDLEPALETHMKEWDVKRCPKCRSGVHKTMGCAVVQCRCGARFCFDCLQPLDTCVGDCTYKAATTTLRAQRGELSSRERSNEAIDQELHATRMRLALKFAACAHEFHHVQLRNDSREAPRPRCFVCLTRVIVVKTSDLKPPATAANDKHEEVKESEVGWQCKCGFVVCGDCKDYYTRNIAPNVVSKP